MTVFAKTNICKEKNRFFSFSHLLTRIFAHSINLWVVDLVSFIFVRGWPLRAWFCGYFLYTSFHLFAKILFFCLQKEKIRDICAWKPILYVSWVKFVPRGTLLMSNSVPRCPFRLSILSLRYIPYNIVGR